MRGSGENETRTGIGTQYLSWHLRTGLIVEGLTGAVQRNDVFDVHVFQGRDGRLHVLIFLGREVEATNERVDPVDTGCRLRLFDGIRVVQHRLPSCSPGSASRRLE